MKEKWILIIAVVALGGIGYIYLKDKQNAAATTPGSIANGGSLTLEEPTALANTSLGSYVDPTGGMDYVDAVPVSVTSPTGFTAQDYNYGTVNEQPTASNGSYDLVTNPGGSGYTIVPTGSASLLSYDKVVG